MTDFKIRNYKYLEAVVNKLHKELSRTYDICSGLNDIINKDLFYIVELQDALEFETRVSARLACTVENLQNLFPPNEMIVIPKETILRDVRIAIEAEMDNTQNES